MRVFVKGPDKDPSAVRELCLMQSFMNQRGLPRAARGGHRYHAIWGDRGLKPVLQFLKPARAAAEMLRRLQRVAKQRFPDAGGGGRGATVLCEIGDRDRDELG